MKKKFVVVCVAAILAIPIFANAIQITQIDAVNGEWLDFNKSWTFDKFDDNGGVFELEWVRMTIHTQITYGWFIVDNDALLPANVTINYNVMTSLTSPDLTIAPFNVNIGGTENLALAANIGDVPGVIDGTPPDGAIVTPDSSMYTNTLFFDKNDPDMAQFIGTGLINTLFTSTRTFNITGASGIEGAYTVMIANAGVEVIYDYNVIPEPATLAILGLGGLMIRRRKK